MRRGRRCPPQGPLAKTGRTPPPLVYRPPLDEGLEILYGDRHLVAVDKPAGLLTVAGKTSDLADCLEARVLARYPSAMTVHRLDRETSGIVLFALTRQAHRQLQQAFEKRLVWKVYRAQIAGHPGVDEGEVDLPLRTDWYARPLQCVDTCMGRPALTRFKVLERRQDGTSDMHLFPITGRSHQLRVHMLELGHPILGDGFYAPAHVQSASVRLCLHAEKIRFSHPETKAPLEISASLTF